MHLIGYIYDVFGFTPNIEFKTYASLFPLENEHERFIFSIRQDDSQLDVNV